MTHVRRPCTHLYMTVQCTARIRPRPTNEPLLVYTRTTCVYTHSGEPLNGPAALWRRCPVRRRPRGARGSHSVCSLHKSVRPITLGIRAFQFRWLPVLSLHLLRRLRGLADSTRRETSCRRVERTPMSKSSRTARHKSLSAVFL